MSDVDAIVDDDAGNRVAAGLSGAALVHIVKSIVDDPEAVVVDVDERGSEVTFEVHVAPDDKGKVIGKRGRVAMSIRTVVRAIGAREGVNVNVDIADD